jgi:hypothetical protein
MILVIGLVGNIIIIIEGRGVMEALVVHSLLGVWVWVGLARLLWCVELLRIKVNEL